MLNKIEPKRVDYFQIVLQRNLYKQLEECESLLLGGTEFNSSTINSVNLAITSVSKDSLKLLEQLSDDEIVIKNNPKAVDYKIDIKDHLSYRGTSFRGVSKNGRCNWQILTMLSGNKVYLATVDSILKAAILYDILSI